MAPLRKVSNLMPRRVASLLGKGIAILLLLASSSVVVLPAGQAAEELPLEYQVKAAFLLNFTKFVEWPVSAFADEHAPLAICILGEDPFGNALNEMLKGEDVSGHQLVMHRVQRVPAPKSCQVLFIPRLEKEVPRILGEIGPGVLTVGEGEKFVRDGGIIGFVLEDRRVRFDINERAAGKAMLTVSSRLLNVARSVDK